MSYINTFEGVFNIDPPLPWAAFRDVKPHDKGPDYYNVDWQVHTEDVETDDGVLTVKTAIGIKVHESRSGREMRDCGAEDQIKRLVGVAVKAGSRVSGEMQRQGERTGDVERWVIRDPRGPGFASPVQSEKARLVWPDGSEVEVL